MIKTLSIAVLFIVQVTQEGASVQAVTLRFHAIHATILQAIEEALDGLSEKHRTVFVLREMEGLSYEQMADAIGCSTGTVMSRLHHARKKLQHALIEMGIVEERNHERM